MNWNHFFTVHKDLPREGPGEAADVVWACELAEVPANARICDAGAGPGADTEVLRHHAMEGGVVAIERQPGFVAHLNKRFCRVSNVTIADGDMAEIAKRPEAPFDMIWCAGALYFLGLEGGLTTFGGALRPGGILAFSEPCLFGASTDETSAFWDGYPAQDAHAISTAVTAAGYDILGQRPVSDAGWEAYYQPMEERIAALRPTADPDLCDMLDMCAKEATDWRRVRHETGYLLTVARKT